jgi:hypothetical protein
MQPQQIGPSRSTAPRSPSTCRRVGAEDDRRAQGAADRVGAGLIRLDQVATVEQSGPTSITTQRGQRTATVSVTLRPTTSHRLGLGVDALAGSTCRPGADAKVGGVVTQQQDAFGQLGLAMLAAILIVYIVMVATFKSLRQPLLLLSRCRSRRPARSCCRSRPACRSAWRRSSACSCSSASS